MSSESEVVLQTQLTTNAEIVSVIEVRKETSPYALSASETGIPRPALPEKRVSVSTPSTATTAVAGRMNQHQLHLHIQ